MSKVVAIMSLHLVIDGIASAVDQSSGRGRWRCGMSREGSHRD